MCLSSLFAEACLPELMRCVEQFSQQPSAATLLEFEQALHHQLQTFGDRIVETRVQEALADATLIAQSVAAYRAKGYRIHHRTKSTTVQLYGGRTCTRHSKKSRMNRGQKRRGFHAEWREPKVLTLYAIDETGRNRNREIHPYCDETHGGRERFKRLLQMQLHKMGVRKAEHVIFVGDGAPWVWNIVSEIITELALKPETVTQILDYYHACENLWKVIDALTDLTQKQKQRLFKKAKTQLFEGQIENLIERLGQKAKAFATASQALKYFHGHETRCRYDLFRAHNFPLGSGAIESTIRRVVNLRLKGAGMFWLEQNAEAFLHLRCQVKSGRWDDFFRRLITL